MLVPRILVPVDAEAAVMDSAGKVVPGCGMGEARAIPRGSRQPVAASRPSLFAEVMLENSPTKPRGRAKDLIVSLTAHGVLLVALFVVPLYFTAVVDLDQFNRTLLVAPLVPAPPPPISIAVSRPIVALHKVLPVAGKLVAPSVIPNQIARTGKEPGIEDARPGIAVGAPGGVPGGQLGGVIGGILTGSSASNIPPPPPVSTPKSPIRVGGDVKAPRLISQVAPIYPVTLRKARVKGSVVIDAVIDAQGNIVEMQPVSGNPFLMPPAMEALRHWKYEPTILNGQAYAVKLLVTIEFRLS
jgi:protein TonB